MNDPPKVRLTIFQVHLQHGTQLLVRSQHKWSFTWCLSWIQKANLFLIGLLKNNFYAADFIFLPRMEKYIFFVRIFEKIIWTKVVFTQAFFWCHFSQDDGIGKHSSLLWDSNIYDWKKFYGPASTGGVFKTLNILRNLQMGQ